MVHSLQQINLLFLKDAGGSRGKVTKVVCSVYYLHSGPEQLRQEGKGLNALERAFLIENRKSGGRKANTRAVLLVKEAIVVTLSPRQYRMGKAMRDKEALW